MNNLFLIQIARGQTILPETPPETWDLPQVMEIIQRIINIGVYLGGGVAVIFILMAAATYFSAYGNEETAKKAKNMIIWTVVGVGLILLSKVLVAVIIKLIS